METESCQLPECAKVPSAISSVKTVRVIFDDRMAARGEVAVAGEFRRRDRGAHVIDLLASRERAVEWNADHYAVAGLFAISKREPPAGKETPLSIMARSAARMLPRTALSGR